MVFSRTDEIIKPLESTIFENFKLGTEKVESLKESSLYYDIGLDKIDKKGKLFIIEMLKFKHDDYIDDLSKINEWWNIAK